MDWKKKNTLQVFTHSQWCAGAQDQDNGNSCVETIFYRFILLLKRPPKRNMIPMQCCCMYIDGVTTSHVSLSHWPCAWMCRVWSNFYLHIINFNGGTLHLLLLLLLLLLALTSIGGAIIIFIADCCVISICAGTHTLTTFSQIVKKYLANGSARRLFLTLPRRPSSGCLTFIVQQFKLRSRQIATEKKNRALTRSICVRKLNWLEWEIIAFYSWRWHCRLH